MGKHVTYSLTKSVEANITGNQQAYLVEHVLSVL
jgi:hypothetical protein